MAWALNLRDSGWNVTIGLRENSGSLTKAKEMGFETFHFERERIPTQTFALLTPDHTHHEILETLSKRNQDHYCLFAHGYSQHVAKFHQIYPGITPLLLAPKAIASEVRYRFETKKPLNCFYSVEFVEQSQQKNALEIIQAVAQALGILNIYPSSFKEETEADLFSEQSILCSLIPYGILHAYNTLIENGYSHEIAFYECFYESKLIIDALTQVGPEKFFSLISPNALIGSQYAQEILLDEDFRAKLTGLLDNIKQNKFTEEINNTELKTLREDVNLFWNQQELSKTYTRLKETL